MLFSANYDPEMHENPNDADWTLIVADANEDSELTQQGPFDLAEIATFKGKIAWKYTSEGGNGDQSSRYT